jgi:hypothetical protein
MNSDTHSAHNTAIAKTAGVKVEVVFPKQCQDRAGNGVGALALAVFVQLLVHTSSSWAQPPERLGCGKAHGDYLDELVAIGACWRGG